MATTFLLVTVGQANDEGETNQIVLGFQNWPLQPAQVRVAVTFLGSRTETFNATTTTAMTGWPTGEPTSGHWAHLFIVQPVGGGQTMSVAPTGWEQVYMQLSPADADAVGYFLTKLLNGTEGFPSWTWSVSGDSACVLCTYSGQASGSTSALVLSDKASSAPAAATTHTTSTITAGAGDLVTSFIGVDAAVGATRPFYTETDSGVTKDVDYEGFNNIEIGVANQPISAAGSVSHTWGLAASESSPMVIVAVKAAGVPADNTGRPGTAGQFDDDLLPAGWF